MYPVMNKLAGISRLARPVNTLICALSVLCGSIIGGKPLDYLDEAVASIGCGELPGWTVRVVFAALSASLILAAGNTFNDVCDLSCDRINAPERPIPAGIVSPREASVFALILASIGISLSFPLGTTGVFVALGAVVMLAAYDMKLKGVPLAGNIVVACLGGLAFIYGGIAGGGVVQSLIPAVFAALFHLGRELTKDAADRDGDSAAGLRTAATVWGVPLTCRLAAAVLTVLAIFTVLPVITGYFGTVYCLIILFGVWPALIYSVTLSLKDDSVKSLVTASRILKADMPIGIVAVLAGFQGW